MPFGPRRRTDRLVLTERSRRPSLHTDVRPIHVSSAIQGRNRMGRVLILVVGSILGSLVIVWLVGLSKIATSTIPTLAYEGYPFEGREMPEQPEKPTRYPPILTIFSESPFTISPQTLPLPNRTTTASRLKVYEYPDFHSRNTLCGKFNNEPLPIDDFPDDDPYLPW